MSTTHRPVPIWLLVLAAVSLVLIAGVAFVLIRNDIRRRHTPISAAREVKSELKALYTGAKAYFAEKDVYTEDMRQMGFRPERGNEYNYFSSPKGSALDYAERERTLKPYHVVPADPKARGFGRRFTAFSDTGCPLTPAVLPDGTLAGLGVTPAPGANPAEAVYIAAAAANLDKDPTLDCWSIATVTRVAADGTPIPEGVPYNEFNDLAP